MISKRDVQLGKIALKENMVSKEQINKCLKIKKKLNTKASLGAILVKKGYINKDELERIVKIHNEARNGASESDISSDAGPDAKADAKAAAKKERSQRRSKRRKTIEKAEEKAIADEAPSERRSKRKKARDADSSSEGKSGSGDEKTEDKAEAASDDKSEQDDKRSRRRSKRETRRASRKAELAEASDDEGSAKKELDKKDADKKDEDKKDEEREARSSRRTARRSKRSKTMAKASTAVQVAEAEPAEASVKTRDKKDSDKKDADKKDADKKSRRSKRSKRDKSLTTASTKASSIDLDELLGDEGADTADKDEADDKKSRRSKRSKRDKKRGSNRVAAEKNGSAGTNGAVLSSASVFESADDMAESQEFDDEGRIQKKIVACSNCGKKYRVKPQQAGKRFGCRRCATKVRVPKDYFEQDEIVGFGPRGKRKGKRSTKKTRRSATAVEEFNIDDVESDDGSGEGSEAAEQAVATATKTRDEARPKDPKKKVATSYAALTKEAMQAPRTIRREERMTKKAILQMAGLALLLFGGVGIFFYIQHSNAAAEAEALQAAIDTEWTSFKTRADASAVKAREVLERELKPGELDVVEEAGSFLVGAIRSQRELRYAENRQRASKLVDSELALETMRFQLLATKARVQASQRSFRSIEEAVRSLEEATALEKVDGQAFIDLGRLLALTRRWTQALEITGKAKDYGPDLAARALSFKGRIYETVAAAKEAADLYERLVAAGTPAGAMLQARAALSARAINDARKLLTELEGQNILGDRPRLRAALKILLGRCDERERQLDKAEANYLQAQTTADDLAWGWLALGELQLRRGQYEAALGSFNTASEKKGGARALIGLARAQFGLLKSDEALATLRKAVTVREAPDTDGPIVAGQAVLINPQEAEVPASEAYRWLGDLYRALERPADATAAYQSALSLDPWNVRAQARFAALEVELDKSEAAGNRLKQALRLVEGLPSQRQIIFDERPRLATEDTGELLLSIGAHAQKVGDRARATEALAFARELLPGSARSFAAMGQVLQLRDRPRGARREFDLSLKIEREHPAYVKGLSDLQTFLDSGDKALLERVLGGAAAALTENPNHAAALCLRGRAQLAAGRIQEGLVALKRAIVLNPYFLTPLLYRGFYNAGLLGGERTDFESAKRDFAGALDIAPKDRRALYGYGLSKLRLGDSAAAIASANAALAVDGEFREAYLLRAQAYKSERKFDLAEADRKRAEAAQPRLSF